MYSIKGKQAARIEPVTFSDLNMLENDIEEFLWNSIDMIYDEEESMLIVGREVKNEENEYERVLFDFIPVEVWLDLV